MSKHIQGRQVTPFFFSLFREGRGASVISFGPEARSGPGQWFFFSPYKGETMEEFGWSPSFDEKAIAAISFFSSSLAPGECTASPFQEYIGHLRGVVTVFPPSFSFSF